LAGLLFRRFLEGTDPTLWKDALFWLLGAYGYFLILTLILGLILGFGASAFGLGAMFGLLGAALLFPVR